MNIKQTERGFDISNFKDLYGEKCSIQKSSLATDDAIWFGIDKPHLTVFEDSGMGKYIVAEMPANFSVNARMHLNKEQVAELLPVLQKFVDTGELQDDSQEEEKDDKSLIDQYYDHILDDEDFGEAKNKAFKIYADITDRSGNGFDNIDDDIKEEILQEWINIIGS